MGFGGVGGRWRFKEPEVCTKVCMGGGGERERENELWSSIYFASTMLGIILDTGYNGEQGRSLLP